MKLRRNSTRKKGAVIFSLELSRKDRIEKEGVKKDDKTDKYS